MPGGWIMRQTWLDLLFAHWPVPERTLRGLVPPELSLDTFDGTAWLGVTPFEVAGLRVRRLPPLPGLSRFPELNVRTYVTAGDRPGIWFFRLYAGSLAAVLGARFTYRLPYVAARMEISRSGDGIRYRCRSGGAELRAEYAPAGAPAPAAAGTLEHFLCERYSLFALDHRRRLHRADIHHPPWPLQPAEATLDAPLLHYAARQDVLIWPLVRARRG